MIRLVLIALVVAALAFLGFGIVRTISKARIDWKSIGLCVGFVVLAVFLRYMTGIGGLG